MLIAERGYIYRWINLANGSKQNLALVVSADARQYDNLTSILFLSPDKGQNDWDVVRFEIDGKSWVVRTDLVTYTPREYLIEQVSAMPVDVMNRVDYKISESLGLNTERTVSYKVMYDRLISKILQTLKKKGLDEDNDFFSN